MSKLKFNGTIISVQPRIRLTRSFDESSHSYLGYAIKIVGTIDGDEKDFSIGIGKAAHEKQQFKAGEVISGECVPVADERLEPVEYYKVSKLKKLSEADTFVTVLYLVSFISQGQTERLKVAMVWYMWKRTGWMKWLLSTGIRMSNLRVEIKIRRKYKNLYVNILNKEGIKMCKSYKDTEKKSRALSLTDHTLNRVL